MLLSVQLAERQSCLLFGAVSQVLISHSSSDSPTDPHCCDFAAPMSLGNTENSSVHPQKELFDFGDSIMNHSLIFVLTGLWAVPRLRFLLPGILLLFLLYKGALESAVPGNSVLTATISTCCDVAEFDLQVEEYRRFLRSINKKRRS